MVERIDQRNWGNTFCLAACKLAIARFYRGRHITMDTLFNSGAVNRSTGFVNVAGVGQFTATHNLALNFTTIFNEIRAGRPVIIRGTTASGSQHFVVGCQATSASAAGITVMEPWGGVMVPLNGSQLRNVTNHRTTRP